MLAELTISYETNFEVAAKRKEEKYNWSPEPVMQVVKLNSSPYLWRVVSVSK